MDNDTEMDDPTSVLFVGDAHGDTGFLEAVIDRAEWLEADAIVQLGDLGAFWPGSYGWLENIDRLLRYARIDRFVFVDGNHEGWTSDVGENGGLRCRGDVHHRSVDGLVTITDRIAWAPRGFRWNWSGVRFGALGGAFSIDHRFRTPGRDWWPEHEAPTMTDVALLGTVPLDVLLTHEAPFVSPFTQRGITLSEADRAAADAPRSCVSQALRNTGARTLFHGHWHERLSYRTNWWDSDGDEHFAEVEALGANIGSLLDATLLVDLALLARNPA